MTALIIHSLHFRKISRNISVKKLFKKVIAEFEKIGVSRSRSYRTEIFFLRNAMIVKSTKEDLLWLNFLWLLPVYFLCFTPSFLLGVFAFSFYFCCPALSFVLHLLWLISPVLPFILPPAFPLVSLFALLTSYVPSGLVL